MHGTDSKTLRFWCIMTVLQYKKASCGNNRAQFMCGQPLSLWYKQTQKPGKYFPSY